MIIVVFTGFFKSACTFRGDKMKINEKMKWNITIKSLAIYDYFKIRLI